MKDKYADQDEEDRALMIDLLGSGKGPQPKGKKEKAKAAKALELADRKKKFEDEKIARLAEKEAFFKVDSNESLESQDAAFTESSKKIARKMMESDIEENLDLRCLDLLSGQPHENDILMHCIPVCAPWIALSKYTYKIKLLPGSLKRGKAAKAAKASFLSMAIGDDIKNSINAVPDSEWVSTILPKVKLVLSSDQASSKRGGKGKN